MYIGCVLLFEISHGNRKWALCFGKKNANFCIQRTVTFLS